MEANKIKFNGFEYTFTDNNDWVYKSVPFDPIKKPKGPEKPHIKMIEELESEYKKEFDAMLVRAVKGIANYLDV